MKIFTVKKFTKYALYLCLALLSFLITSCKKELFNPLSTQAKSANLKSNEQLISEAQSFFEKTTSHSDQLSKANSSDLYVENNPKTPDFTKALVSDMSIGKVVVTPVNFTGRALFAKVGSRNVNISSYSKLLIYTDSLGNKTVDLLIGIPTESFLTDTNSHKKFSGILSVTDWQGKYKSAYSVNNGQIVAVLGEPERHFGQPANAKTQSIKSQNYFLICTTVEWYAYNGQQGSSIKSQTDLGTFTYGEYTFCILSGGGSSPGSSNNGFNPSDYSLAIGGTYGGSGGCAVAQGQSISGKKVNDTDPCVTFEITEKYTDVTDETAYSDDDVDYLTGTVSSAPTPNYVKIAYTHTFTVTRDGNTGIIKNIQMDPVSADPIYTTYPDGNGYFIQRYLTLFDKVAYWGPVGTGAELYWGCVVNARYIFSNGATTKTIQWNHSHRRII